MSNPIIIFYDGPCGLCNRLVNRLLRLDYKKRLKFSPLQGQTAETILPRGLSEDLNTMVFLKDGRLYTKSDAVLEVLKTLGGVFSLFYIFKLIPRGIRDSIYDFVSKNRIRWFGTLDGCRIPTKEERDRFLD